MAFLAAGFFSNATWPIVNTLDVIQYEKMAAGNCAVKGIIATAKMRITVFIVFMTGLLIPISVPSSIDANIEKLQMTGKMK